MDARAIQPFIIPIVLVILGLVILNYFRKKVEGVFGATNDEQKESEQNQVSGTKVNTKNLNYTNTEYSNLANKAYTAMKGVGTEEDSLLSVIDSVKNNDDWQQIVKSFGVKEGDNLLTWMRNELPENSFVFTDLKSIRKKLELKGVKTNLP